MISSCYTHFAVSQKASQYERNAMVLCALAHAALIGLFCFRLDWGYDGVCWATALMWLIRMLINVGQVKYLSDLDKHDDVYLFSWETVTNIGPLLDICLN